MQNKKKEKVVLQNQPVKVQLQTKPQLVPQLYGPPQLMMPLIRLQIQPTSEFPPQQQNHEQPQPMIPLPPALTPQFQPHLPSKPIYPFTSLFVQPQSPLTYPSTEKVKPIAIPEIESIPKIDQQQIISEKTTKQNVTNAEDEIYKLKEENLKMKRENESLKKENESLKKEIESFHELNIKVKSNVPHSIKPFDATEIDNFSNKTLIGHGGQSRVYQITSEVFYALKELEVTGNSSDNFIRMKHLLQEYEIINSLCHPNIIKTLGIFFGGDNHPPSIVLEFCHLNLLKGVKQLNDKQRVSTIFEISSAMKEVHKNKIIHRDLKPENILFDNEMHAKVSDFGISTINQSEGDENSHTIGVGTLKFMAPEILNEESHYNEKVDVYSFGVVVFFILTNGQYPRITIPEIAMGKKAQIPLNINQVSRELILRCWSTKSEDRPSFSEIVEYIKDKDFMLIDNIEFFVPQIKEFLSL